MKSFTRTGLKRFLLLLTFVAGLTAFSSARAANAVGYVNKELRPGFTLLTNPLLANDNSIGAIMRNVQGGVPEGLTVYVLENGNFKIAMYDSSTDSFSPPEVAAELISPGRGFFVFNPTSTTVVVTFVGEVLQGTLVNPVEKGFSIVGSMVPRSATPEELNFPGEAGDVIYFFDSVTKNFQVSVFDDLDNQWSPALRALAPGEAFVVFKTQAADWVQEFSINPSTARTLAFPALLF